MAAPGSTFNSRYSKWNSFDDEVDGQPAGGSGAGGRGGSGGATGAPAPKPTMRFDLGDGDVVAEDIMLATPEQVAAAKKWPVTEKEVWQVLVRKLRVWSAESTGAAEGPDAVPCRPYCLLINNLYPLGRVLGKHLCDPPERVPTPAVVLREIFETMSNPPSGIPRHRPGKVRTRGWPALLCCCPAS
jgi:hypothetical protein